MKSLSPKTTVPEELRSSGGDLNKLTGVCAWIVVGGIVVGCAPIAIAAGATAFALELRSAINKW